MTLYFFWFLSFLKFVCVLQLGEGNEQLKQLLDHMILFSAWVELTDLR